MKTLILSVCLAGFAGPTWAAFVRFPSRPTSADPNLNFIDDAKIDPSNLRPPALALVRAVDDALVLPPSTRDSFLSLVEKPLHDPAMKLPHAASHVIDRSFGSSHQPVAGEFYVILRQISRRRDLGVTDHVRGGAQVLVGDRGAVGKTTLIKSYLEASGRTAYLTTSDASLAGLALFVHQSLSNPGRVLLIEDRGAHKPEVRDVLLFLLENREILGRTSLIITTNGIESEWTRRVRERVDGIHHLSRPGSADVIAAIIARNGWGGYKAGDVWAERIAFEAHEMQEAGEKISALATLKIVLARKGEGCDLLLAHAPDEKREPLKRLISVVREAAEAVERNRYRVYAY